MLRKPDAVKVERGRRKYIGFDIPNEFVVGYGLDYAEKYRNLRVVGTLAPHVYAERPSALRASGAATTGHAVAAVGVSATVECLLRPCANRVTRRCRSRCGSQTAAGQAGGAGAPPARPSGHPGRMDVKRFLRGPIFWILIAMLLLLIGSSLVTRRHRPAPGGHLRDDRPPLDKGEIKTALLVDVDQRIEADVHGRLQEVRRVRRRPGRQAAGALQAKVDAGSRSSRLQRRGPADSVLVTLLVSLLPIVLRPRAAVLLHEPDAGRRLARS